MCHSLNSKNETTKIIYFYAFVVTIIHTECYKFDHENDKRCKYDAHKKKL